MAGDPPKSDRTDAYAAALFEVAKAEGSLAVVEEELFRIARTVEGSDELRSTLTDQAVPVERRQGIVEDLFGGKASPVTTALVSFVVGAGRSKDLPAIIDRLVERAAQERSEAVAEVRSAIPLDDSQRERLAAALGKATGKSISLKVIVDPSILGGIVAQVGDTVIDGSVRNRINQLREAL
jgi:F-type H+-transporting ATPase subunit delta